jgi:trk system potassium uptake protein TrkH
MTSVIALGFVAIILLGAFLLMLPISSQSGEFTDPLDAAFTAVSATCVTGLAVVDTGTYWSLFGQIVIIVLIQIGGLGFMTMAVLLSRIIRRKVTPRERMLVAMSYNLNTYESTMPLVTRILVGTFAAEGLGAAALATQFIPIFGTREGIYKSIYHSVSAFCNAGFDLFGDYSGRYSSLVAFNDNPVVAYTIMFLIVFGGIGFVVWDDLINLAFKKKRVSAYSKFVMIVYGILLFGGAILFMIFEWSNPATIGNMSIGNKIMNSLFQSVTMRTAGFSMIDNAAMNESSQLLSVALMFVGGASGSTAGGVKVATMGILLYTVFSVSIGKTEVLIFGRKISHESFMRSVAVVVVQLFLVIVGTAAVSYSMDMDTMTALFEIMSAGGTVGISLGVTPSLNIFSKIIVMLMMYFGRVGILTVTYAVMFNLSKKNVSGVSHPEANMLVGSLHFNK